ncbi:MAG: type 12 [Rhodospirillaceae bacterium]|nr:MAG: type 12 [Rhodospirillaceae bacterium]TNC97470.1 MAG: type 12 methyltransferase [Stygiobacter sp.]
MAALTSHPLFHDGHAGFDTALDSEQQILVRDFNAKAKAGEINFQHEPCIICGSQDGDLISTYDRYRVWQPMILCKGCGLVRCTPRMADDILTWFYGSDFYRKLTGGNNILPHDRQKFMVLANRMARRHATITSLVPKVRSVAEIGCGAGWNLWPFHLQGCKVVGCDYGPALTSFGRDEMGMDLRTGSTEMLDSERFDVIILSHVLEHMPDPAAEISRLLPHLADDGIFYVEVPDARGICHGALHSAHLYYFTPTHMRALLAKCGLEAIAEHTHDGNVHFSLVARRSSTPVTIDLSMEYQRQRHAIRRIDQRMRLKSALERLGILDLVKRLIRR